MCAFDKLLLRVLFDFKVVFDSFIMRNVVFFRLRFSKIQQKQSEKLVGIKIFLYSISFNLCFTKR